MTADQLDIRPVRDDEAGELLTLRRAAFVTEAQVMDDPHIPPLTQTLDELRADLVAPGVITLGAWSAHRLVASIRVLVEGTRATLGRFVVAPDLQGRGVGTGMLTEIVPYLPDGISEVWIFTARDSVHNIAMYQRNGYTYQHDQTAGDLTYAYLRKLLGDDSSDLDDSSGPTDATEG